MYAAYAVAARAATRAFDVANAPSRAARRDLFFFAFFSFSFLRFDTDDITMTLHPYELTLILATLHAAAIASPLRCHYC